MTVFSNKNGNRKKKLLATRVFFVGKKESFIRSEILLAKKKVIKISFGKLSSQMSK
jgi:hypothetical protein